LGRGQGASRPGSSGSASPKKTRSFSFDALAKGWERAAAERLTALLSHKELEELLGDLLYSVRQARARETGKDRRGRKDELAAALLIQHGIDLFRNGEIRELVGRKCKVDVPGRWHPGKWAAERFVEKVEFPPECAGIPSEESLPDFEYLEGRVDLRELQDFQREVQAGMRQVLSTDGGRAIVTLPTGAGKTRVAVDTIRDWLAERWSDSVQRRRNTVLWLAHTEELCEQAYACFREVWQASSNVSPLLLFRFWGGFTRDLAEHGETLRRIQVQPAVLISTPQRIAGLLEGSVPGAEEAVEALAESLRLLVVDEAHRAAAPTYRKILAHFGAADSGASVVGLTATPFRMEYLINSPTAGTEELRELFRTIIEPTETLGTDPRQTLQERGFLSRPEWEVIKTETVLTPPPDTPDLFSSEQDIERVDHALRIRADNPARRFAILDYILPYCETPGTLLLYFGPSVLDAECMAFLLRQRGVPAAFLSGETRDVTRRKVITDFKRGRLQVLCNCEVLTTGFDAPKVTHVVMARPTVSQVLYEQMVGRGLRGPKFGGTPSCTIIDCEDSYKADRPVLGYRAFRAVWEPK
jgi:DNA repair protein RadD